MSSASLASRKGATPATVTAWVPTGYLNVARAYHTATLLPNGKVLVVGGLGPDPYPNNVLATAELYDPATGTWTPTENMLTSQSSASATLLPSGRVLVCGGDAFLSGACELYVS